MGSAHQRRSGGPERASLRETDELVARLGPAPALGHDVSRTNRIRQQRAEQAQPEFARGDAFVALLVLVDDRVDARRSGAARLAESDLLAGDVLQLDRHVLEHMTEPGALVLAHAAEEAARLVVGTAVLRETRQCRGQCVDEAGAETCRRPLLEVTEVELEPDDREMGVERRADVNGTIEDAHIGLPLPPGGSSGGSWHTGARGRSGRALLFTAFSCAGSPLWLAGSPSAGGLLAGTP